MNSSEKPNILKKTEKGSKLEKFLVKFAKIKVHKRLNINELFAASG